MRKTFEPPPADPVIIFENVSKMFKLRHARSLKQTVLGALRRQPTSDHFAALDHLDLEVYPGESVAILGRNGSGKSTTLKLLSGVLRPTSGEIFTMGRVAGLLEVGAGFHPDLTGRENVYLNAAILGMSRAETDERFDDIVAFSELEEFIDTEVKRYSSGMYARLGFSVAVHTEHDVLLVDEVLSVGDAEFRAKCNAKMAELQAAGKTMFIVSHSAQQVRKLCQRGIVLDHGRKVFDGSIDEAVKFMAPPKSRPQADLLAAPVVSRNPKSVTVAAGETAAFTAQAKGAQTVRWQTRAPGSRWAWAAAGTSTTLKVAKVQSSESGTLYRAFFKNSAGRVYTKAAKLTVAPAEVPASPSLPTEPHTTAAEPAPVPLVDTPPEQTQVIQREPTELQRRLAEQNQLRQRVDAGNFPEAPVAKVVRTPDSTPDQKPRHGK